MVRHYKITKSMRIQQTTKFFHIVNDVIEAGIEKLGLNGVRGRYTSYDWRKL